MGLTRIASRSRETYSYGTERPHYVKKIWGGTMGIRRQLGLAFLALVLVAAAQADPASTVQKLIGYQIIVSAQSQNGVGVVTVGSEFPNGDFQSQQVLCGTILAYLQGLDPSVQQFTLVDGSGNNVGTYSAGQLILSGS